VPSSQVASSPDPERNPRAVDLDLHLRGMLVAVGYPLAFFIIKYSFDPHDDDSPEVLLAKANSVAGVATVAKGFGLRLSIGLMRTLPYFFGIEHRVRLRQ
jgi:hypothetical protein